ncbi:putative drug exporter of the RND superfamily [Rhodococcoides kroppenstedtii]|uniref:Putative drug exporter of the RND superfamily n=1 Tax=Rhodococcoides kroppenstedtii TaxID=293050 RepID=A0A1I0SYI4_9NOCA|nr:MMPL family transporter [Rhodococcus kroppenstedtii]SFA44579.1 putative drug exporter of the RND superfamily [Rhodococcus kroppenstedtii]
MATFLYRIGRFAYRRKGIVLPIWLAILVLAGVGAATLSGPTSTSFSIPGTPAQQALDLQSERFGGGENPLTAASAQYVFEAPAGTTLESPEATAAIDATIANIRGIGAVKDSAKVDPAAGPVPEGAQPLLNPVAGNQAIVDQYAQAGAPPDVAAADAAAVSPLSPDKTVGIVTVPISGTVTDITDQTRTDLENAAQPARDAGLTVEIGGSAMQSASPPGGTAELIGLAVAAVVLVVMFGSFVAAGLPLITAIVGIGVTSLTITTASGFAELTQFTPILAIMIGLAVAIDYSLFIVARFKNELSATEDREEAAGRAVGTAGSAVVFAGTTVLIALVALRVVGIPFLSQMGLAAGFGVFVAVLVALTMLPAVLGLFGRKAFAGKIRTVPDPEHSDKPTNGLRWVRIVLKRPAIVLVLGVIVLGVIAGPMTSLRLALPSVATAEPGTPAREAYDLIDKGFGPGRNGQLLMVVDGSAVPEADRAAAFAAVVERASSEPDVANAQQAGLNPAGDTALVSVTPKSSPISEDTQNLVTALRGAEGDLESQYGVTYGVTGQTALEIDVSERLQDALVPYLAVVVGLAFLLLMVVFRSILVPLTATLGFLLSVLATFGATVFLFQEGGLGLVSNPQPIVSFMPIFLIGVVFGLAMDYQVFLVSRMREAYVHGADASEAIVTGFKYGARVVAAAAVIMISVFAAFMLEPDAFIKSIGFALAAAVFFDAFVVRMVLIPAVMALLGDKAWYLPRWLDRILPNVDIEGEKLVRTVEREKEQVTG